MGHNCGTCWHLGKTCWPDRNAPEHWSSHPSDMHPCDAHGEPVVATAVAGVEFDFFDGDLGAYHQDAGEKYPASQWVYDEGRWQNLEEGFDVARWKFCPICGLRLPTASQLPEIYQGWKEEHKNA